MQDFKVLSLINNGFINNLIVGYYSSKYDEQTSGLILLLVFNYKINDVAKDIYTTTAKLSMAYLIAVSGFQISLCKWILNKIIPSKYGKIIGTITFVTLYTYLLNFNPGPTRVLLCSIIPYCFSKYKLSKYDYLAISGLINLLIEPVVVVDYGFLMSYLCTYVVMWIFAMEIKNKFFLSFLLNLGCTIVTIPLMSWMHSGVSLTQFFVNFALTPVISFYYVYFLFTFWIVWIAPAQQFIAHSLYSFVYALNELNIVVSFPKFNEAFTCVYFVGMAGGFFAYENKVMNKELNSELKIPPL
ncbi:MAG: ComEC/Rec2 family competence protein [Mycoplasmataceae bacterium]|nr:ComEC/Rec2 family competence protein [Mycoplasmataceae bacterium]